MTLSPKLKKIKLDRTKASSCDEEEKKGTVRPEPASIDIGRPLDDQRCPPACTDMKHKP